MGVFRLTIHSAISGRPLVTAADQRGVGKGVFYVNETPGWGVDINEEAAKKYPYPENPGYWEPVRRRDGTAVRP